MCTYSQANEGHTYVNTLVQGKQSKSQKLNESTLNAYSLHVNIEFVDLLLFSLKRVASYCRISQIPVLIFFFQSVLLQLLEADLVQTNNKCILCFDWDNLQFVRTKAASNSCKRTLWKKKLVRYLFISPSMKLTKGSLSKILKLIL